MARAAVAQELAVKNQSVLADQIDDQIDSSEAARGVSLSAEDSLIPILSILQDMNDEVKSRSPDFIPGAQPGMIWNKATKELIDGQTGILFQPCHFRKAWVEYIPRAQGGGFVNSFEVRPQEAVQVEKNQWKMPNGNELTETRYHVGNVIREDGELLPAVIPMSSTAHQVSRGWIELMKTRRLNSKDDPTKKIIAPSYFCAYNMRTREMSNASGTWFGWDIKLAGWLHPSIRERGQELHDAIEAGRKVVDETRAQMHDSDGVM